MRSARLAASSLSVAAAKSSEPGRTVLNIAVAWSTSSAVRAALSEPPEASEAPVPPGARESRRDSASSPPRSLWPSSDFGRTGRSLAGIWLEFSSPGPEFAAPSLTASPSSGFSALASDCSVSSPSSSEPATHAATAAFSLASLRPLPSAPPPSPVVSPAGFSASDSAPVSAASAPPSPASGAASASALRPLRSELLEGVFEASLPASSRASAGGSAERAAVACEPSAGFRSRFPPDFFPEVLPGFLAGVDATAPPSPVVSPDDCLRSTLSGDSPATDASC
jgi:hypothetical protein